MVSHQLVEQWRVRLADWRQRLDEGRPQPWLARAYVRVLSYLLAQYAGQAEIEPQPRPAKTAAPPQRVIAVSSDLSGKPARTANEIRSVLESVTRQVPHVSQGPYMEGLHPEAPIVVAAYYSAQLASDVRGLLVRAGIESRSNSFRRQTQVVVRACDLERAKPVAAAHAKSSCDSSLLRRQLEQTWMNRSALIGFCIGVTVGTSFIVAVAVTDDASRDTLMAAALAAIFSGTFFFMLLGSVIGFLLGTVAGRWRSR